MGPALFARGAAWSTVSCSRRSRTAVVVRVAAFEGAPAAGRQQPKHAAAAQPGAAPPEQEALPLLPGQEHHPQRPSTSGGGEPVLQQSAAHTPAELAQALADYAASQQRQPDVLLGLSRGVARSCGSFDAVTLLRVMQAFKASGQADGHRDVLAICAAVLGGKLDELPPRDLAAVAATCASLDLNAADMLAALAARSSELLPRFSAPELVTLLAGLAGLQHRAPSLFHDAADALAEQRLAGVAAPAVAQAVWALAAVGLYHQPLFDRAEEVLMPKLRTELDGDGLARVAWSYTQVRHHDEQHRGPRDRDLFDAIAQAAIAQGVQRFPLRAAVTLLWSFSRIPHHDGRLLEVLTDSLATRLKLRRDDESGGGAGAAAVATSSDIVAVAWAVTRLQYSNRHLMAALGDAVVERMQALDAQHADELGCGSDRLAMEFDGDDLTTIAQAFPAAKVHHDKLFRYLLSEAARRPELFGHVALLDLARTVSRVQHQDPAFYGPALDALLADVHNLYMASDDDPQRAAGMLNLYRYGYYS